MPILLQATVASQSPYIAEDRTRVQGYQGHFHRKATGDLDDDCRRLRGRGPEQAQSGLQNYQRTLVVDFRKTQHGSLS
jgi:hypothetical protein